MTATLPTTTSEPIATHAETLNRDGITALKRAFSREWADAMREEMGVAEAEERVHE